MKQSELITAALKGDATLVVKNARVVNVFTNEILEGDVALSEDTIIGVGKGFAAREEIDAGGAYLCPDLECLKRARKSRALERALETAITPELYDELEREMVSGG